MYIHDHVSTQLQELDLVGWDHLYRSLYAIHGHFTLVVYMHHIVLTYVCA